MTLVICHYLVLLYSCTGCLCWVASVGSRAALFYAHKKSRPAILAGRLLIFFQLPFDYAQGDISLYLAIVNFWRCVWPLLLTSKT